MAARSRCARLPRRAGDVPAARDEDRRRGALAARARARAGRQGRHPDAELPRVRARCCSAPRSSARSRSRSTAASRRTSCGSVFEHADSECCSTSPRGRPARRTTRRSSADVPGRLASRIRPALELVDAPDAAADRRHRRGAARAGPAVARAFLLGGRSVELDEIRTLQQRVRIRDIALLMYTSGTTAHPKGCLLTHEALVGHGANVAAARFWLDRGGPLLGSACRCSTSAGSCRCSAASSSGATYYHAGHFDATQSLRHARATSASPSPIRRSRRSGCGVLNHPRLPRGRPERAAADPEHRRARAAGADAARRLPGAVEVSSFGATECSSNLTLPMPDDPLRGAHATRWADRVAGHGDPDRRPRDGRASAPPDEVGELCFRGYARFEGYYKEPELTASAIDADGWFHTGDLGTIDEHGRLIYAGRLKDMLKVGGENVSALEVEEYLAGHPAVDIVQVVGAPDARYAEVPAAFVQLQAAARALERAGADRLLRRAGSRRTRCRATSASSTSGRCPARRSRSSCCARGSPRSSSARHHRGAEARLAQAPRLTRAVRSTPATRGLSTCVRTDGDHCKPAFVRGRRELETPADAVGLSTALRPLEGSGSQRCCATPTRAARRRPAASRR